MASVYILFSPKLNKFYTGSCLNIDERLLDHENKRYANSFTKVADDWMLHFEINELDYDTARMIETHIKSMKSKTYIENLRKYPEMTMKLIARFSKTT
jgi:putative endonuclease